MVNGWADDRSASPGVMAAPATMTCSYPANRTMHDRMVELVEPSRQPAAILFADLPRSCELARRLPTAVYFGLLQRLTETFDELVNGRGGIVGKHAGDGMTAFFLETQLGDKGRAAAAALRTAAELHRPTPEL